VAAALRRLLAQPATDRLLGLVERLPRAGGTVAILTYHRLDLGPGPLYPGLATSTPERFTAQVEALCERATPISAEQLLAAVRGEPLPPRAVLVTFDDGYRDFADVAWPILRRQGVPVVLFVPTDYPDRPERRFWWDRLHHALAVAGPQRRAALGLEGDLSPSAAFRALRGRLKAMPHDDAMATIDRLVAELVPEGGVAGPGDAGPGDAGPGDAGPGGNDADRASPLCSWAELAELAAQGVTVAPHSRSHPLLERLGPERLDDEIAGSFADLRARLGHVAPIFAYPSGSHDAGVRAAVARAGFEVALTTERGVARPGREDPLRLPRINIGRASTPAVVGAQAVVLGRRPFARASKSARHPARVTAPAPLPGRGDRSANARPTMGDHCAPGGVTGRNPPGGRAGSRLSQRGDGSNILEG
jgi:peptidoglycan/xylan/chitin deacetylase (PgdA/CDA1 family)